MNIRKTISFEPDVAAFLSQQDNYSKFINDLVKNIMYQQEQKDMIQAYQQMYSAEALEEQHEWDRTIIDGMES